jgi:ABC-type uncharacterized transport system substrate-binding protein
MKQLFISLILLFSVSLPAYGETIYVRYSESNPIFKESADKLHQKIKQRLSQTENQNKQTLLISEKQKLSPQNSDLIINLGITDFSVLESNSATNVASFIRLKDFDSLSAKMKNKISNLVAIEQPVEKSIELAKKLIKNEYKNKVIICASEEKSFQTLNEIAKEKTSFIKVVLVKKTQTPGKVIQKYLDNAAAIVAVRDEHVWSKKNARLMLHQAYRNKVPIIGYSKAFIKSGAMLSVYSSSENILKELLALVDLYIRGKKSPSEKIIYPNSSFDINKNIAKALKFDMKELNIIEENK